MSAYTATSLADIANAFEQNAQKAQDRAAVAGVSSNKRKLLTEEARVWDAAADMLRSTTIPKLTAAEALFDACVMAKQSSLLMTGEPSITISRKAWDAIGAAIEAADPLTPDD